ncbi:hypothetical protein [Flavobacterium sp.]|jgi:small-conductance mechanosensitive channel|uniref:hypothetical protein n=1 Tax=Flavobacterium sp. TaxID=239 RepID=UPI00391D95A2
MFVRQKKNKSGVVSIQVIDKSSGRYKLLRTIGSSSDLVQIDKLIEEARNYIKEIKKLNEFDFQIQMNLFKIF